MLSSISLSSIFLAYSKIKKSKNLRNTLLCRTHFESEVAQYPEQRIYMKDKKYLMQANVQVLEDSGDLPVEL